MTTWFFGETASREGVRHMVHEQTRCARSTLPCFLATPVQSYRVGSPGHLKNILIGRGAIMFAKIRHVAVLTENWDRMAKFYQTIFGMKKITNGMTDATGTYNPERGHISDGLIGYALLQRQPGIGAGLDHFG